MIRDPKDTDFFSRIEARDLKNLLYRRLARAQRCLLFLYYLEEMTMKDIGKILGLSESRVSQVHSSVIEKLQEHFDSADRYPACI